jgi:P-type E1-E2 ATPase
MLAVSHPLLRADGASREIPVNKLQQGDLIQIRSGEKFAVDGSVHSGYSLVDESMLSGEALPVYKTVGAQVFAGTINQNASLVYRAEKLGKDILLSQINQQVQKPQQKSAEKAIKLAAVLVPCTCLWLFFLAGCFLGGRALSLG